MAATTYHQGLIQIRPQIRDSTARVHENVMWYAGSFSGNLTSGQLQAIASTFGAQWGALWQPNGSPSATFFQTIVTDWSNSSGLQFINPASFTGTGTGGLPFQVSVLISQKGTVRYKGGHARIYLPAVSAGVTTDDITVTTTAQNNITAAITTLFSDMAGISTANGGPFYPQIWRQRTQVVPHTEPPTYMPAFLQLVNTAACNPTLATQRRRLRKVPHH